MNTQRSESRARSLVELTDDTTIFALLHLNMAMILRDANAISASSCPSLNETSINRNVASHLRTLYSQASGIGRKNFLHCAYNLLIGNQIVFKSDCLNQARKTLLTLSNLLPDRGVRVSFDCDCYFEPSVCNLLHVKSNVAVPSMGGKNVLLLESLGPKDFKLTISCDQTLIPEKLPQFLAGLDQILSDTQYSDECLTCYLESLKHEWVSKSKLLAALERTPNASFKILGITEADLKLVHFWKSFSQTD